MPVINPTTFYPKMTKDVNQPNEATQLLAGLLTNTVQNKILSECDNEIGQAKEDQYLRENSSWDDLHKLHASMSVLLRTHAAHSVTARCTQVVMAIENRGLFITAFNALVSQLKLLSTELSVIHQLHRDRTGASLNHRDVLDTIDVYDKYMTLQDRHDNILMVTSDIISIMVAKAEKKLTEEGQQVIVDQWRIDQNKFINEILTPQEPAMTPEQDPTVVTDVQVK